MRRDSKICVAIAPTTASELATRLDEAMATEPGFIEIRFDAVEPSELSAAVEKAQASSARCRLIATFRPEAEGGFRQISDTERKAFWRDLPSGFWGCDVESDAVSWVGLPNKIVERHDFNGVPADVDRLFDELSDTGPQAVKLAVMPRDTVTALPVWKTLLRASEREGEAIVIAMGDAGKWTRILAPSRGALLTYASLDGNGATASGQVTADEMRELYRVDEIDAKTRIYGVIGDPIGQSLSPYIHDPLFQKAGLNAVFLPFLVKDLRGFIEKFVRPQTQEAGLSFGGLSVTMPHKLAIIELLDELDESARKAGAVNTVKVDDGKLVGLNTDADGFLEPLKRRVQDLKGVKVAIFGSGGAARACLSALAETGAEITVFARNMPAAESLQPDLKYAVADLRYGNDLSGFDIIVNATPIGMRGEFENASPVPEAKFSEGQIVYDLVTKATDTPLLASARKAGARVIPGIEMLISQGLRQFEIWTGQHGDEQLVRESLAKKMRR